MTFSEDELINICHQLAWLRRNRRRSSLRWDDANVPDLPAFQYLGSGRDREVWGYGDFAFKLEHVNCQSDEPNTLEFEKYTQIVSDGRIPDNWAVPTMRLFEAFSQSVMVCELVPFTLLKDIPNYDDLVPTLWSDCEQMGISDVADCNFAYDHDTGTVYALDLTT